MGLLQRIVRNDAMKIDPPEIYSWHVLLLACSVRRLFAVLLVYEGASD